MSRPAYEDRKLAGVKVAILDDNRHMATVIMHIFRSFGMLHVEVFQDPIAALKAAEAVVYDIMLIDYHMDTIDGLDFVRLVRKGEQSRNTLTPIILVTAFTERWRVEAARDAGFTEVCAKPISGRELWRKFASVVNEPRPFVRVGDYFGPDRRRRTDMTAHEDRRMGPDVVLDAPPSD